MMLTRLITLTSLQNNVRFFCRHVMGQLNVWADFLLRGKLKQFHQLAKEKNVEFEPNPTKIPRCIWPIEKIWKP